MAPEQFASLFQYGVLGLFVVAILTGQLHPKSRVDREVQISEREHAVNEKIADALDRLTEAVNLWRSSERREGPR